MAVSLQYADLRSFGYKPRNGIAGSNGGSIPSFLRNLHTAFQCSCTNLQSHQQCMSERFPPHPRQRLLLLVFLIIAILTGVRWNLRVILMCISLIARDDEKPPPAQHWLLGLSLFPAQTLTCSTRHCAITLSWLILSSLATVHYHTTEMQIDMCWQSSKGTRF